MVVGVAVAVAVVGGGGDDDDGGGGSSGGGGGGSDGGCGALFCFLLHVHRIDRSSHCGASRREFGERDTVCVESLCGFQNLLMCYIMFLETNFEGTATAPSSARTRARRTT